MLNFYSAGILCWEAQCILLRVLFGENVEYWVGTAHHDYNAGTEITSTFKYTNTNLLLLILDTLLGILMEERRGVCSVVWLPLIVLGLAVGSLF